MDKVEERQFRSALAKHKSDLYAISKAIAKSFAAVVRFFVEDGLRRRRNASTGVSSRCCGSRERSWKNGKPSVDGASGGGSAGGGGAGGGGARNRRRHLLCRRQCRARVFRIDRCVCMNDEECFEEC